MSRSRRISVLLSDLRVIRDHQQAVVDSVRFEHHLLDGSTTHDLLAGIMANR
jgi:hypothetical protein